MPLLLALLPAALAAWPAEDQWIALGIDGFNLEDEAFDFKGPQRVDLVGEGAETAGWWYADADALYLRMRLNADPCMTRDEKSGECTALYDNAWGWLFSTDGEGEGYESALALRDEGGVLLLAANSDDGVGWQDPWEKELLVGSAPLPGGQARVEEAGSALGGDADYLLAVQVPLPDLLASLGTEFAADLRVALATEADGAAAGALATDLAGATGSGGLLADALSAPLVLDADDDGLNVGEEADADTDPEDPDSDDDGLSDGEEVHERGTDPLLCDSDADGLPDGLEAGVTEPGEGTEEGCFRPDADPGTTTDPAAADTDGGGLADGAEDWSGDGRIDPFETDPANPQDDTDADGDGIADAAEAECGGEGDDGDGDGVPDGTEGWIDSDGDGLPDFCDEDDDADGVPTAAEGSGDTDADESPDRLDEDADNDGRLDGEEGTGDEDCDEIANFQDANDNDGPCGEGFEDPEQGGSLYGFSGGSFTGGSCAAAPGRALLLPALLAALALLRRRWAGFLALTLLIFPGAASAQEVNAQLFQPAFGGRYLTVTEGADVGGDGPGGGLLLNYADDPFVYRYGDSRGEVDILGSVLTADTTAFYTLRPFQFGVGLPVHLAADGYGLTGGLRKSGDVRLAARATIRDPRQERLGVGASAGASLPTGDGSAWLGEPTATFWARGHLSLDRLALPGGRPLLAAADLGVLLAPKDTAQILDDMTWGSRLQGGVGAAAPLRDPLWVSAELRGHRLLASEGAAFPLEALVSLRALAGESLVANVGVGRGLTRGVGAPDARLVAGLTWAPPSEAPPPVPASLFRYFIIVSDPSGAPIPANIAIPRRGLEVQAGPDGKLEGQLPRGAYEVEIEAPGYARARRVLEGEPGGFVSLEVVLHPPRVSVDQNRLALTDKIFFEFDSAVISAQSHSLLDEVADLLAAHPEIRLVEIQGHTDDQGEPGYNQTLSRERAEAVRLYLVERGISARRLRAEGYGESYPLQEGTTEEARAVNRRVEFVLLQVKEK